MLAGASLLPLSPGCMTPAISFYAGSCPNTGAGDQAPGRGRRVELSMNLREDFTVPGKGHTRAFSWLKVPNTRDFTIKNLLRHYANQT